MGTSPHRSEGRRPLRAVVLSDVPDWIRYRAADRLLRETDSLADRAAVMVAAQHPSDRVYFVPVSDEKWDRVMRPRRRR